MLLLVGLAAAASLSLAAPSDSESHEPSVDNKAPVVSYYLEAAGRSDGSSPNPIAVPTVRAVGSAGNRQTASLAPSIPTKGTQGSNKRSGTPPAAVTPSVSSPLRVIVKLRAPQSRSLSQALAPGADAIDLATASTTDAQLGSLFSKHAVRKATPLSIGHVRGRYDHGRSKDQLTNTTRLRFHVRQARAARNATPPDLSGTYVLDLENRSAVEATATIHSLKNDPHVLYAEEDKVVRAQYVPNDPSYSSAGSWGQSYDDLHGLKSIGTTQAWDVSQGQGAVVAVVDTGIDYNHPDIAGNVWINTGEIPGNGIDDDNNGFIDDVRGWDFVGTNYTQPQEDNDPFDGFFHGTHVAGTIAATGDNNLGVVGVAWKAKVMAVKGLDDSGTGYDSQLAKAIIYAADNGADVINASFGSEGTSQVLADAIGYAHALGVVVVAAAGNSSSDASGFYPANVPEAIAVSALDPYDNFASGFSNFGNKVELGAPGVDILSLKAGTTGYSQQQGTSMAAPHVSGVAALIIAQHPSFTSEQIRQVLRTSATDLFQAGKDSFSGYGRVNAAQAVLINQVLEAKFFAPADGNSITAATTLVGTAAGPGFDHYVVDFGAGSTPDSWTTLSSGTAGVTNQTIAIFDPSTLPEGLYSVRIRAFDLSGSVFSDQIRLNVHYLKFTTPAVPRLPSLTCVVKPGVSLAVSGSAQGASFHGYTLEWASGTEAPSGWSTDGFSLANNGLVPITNGALGTWTPPQGLQGYCTIRLTVADGGLARTATTTIYSEPALASAAWPRLVPNIDYHSSALPVRLPDGTSRLVFSGTSGGVFTGSGSGPCLSAFALDGTMTTVPLYSGGNFQPSVANLDGQPGEEIVVADYQYLKVFSSDLTLIRTITASTDWTYSFDQVSLADLDNDGIPEILAPARNTAADISTGALYIYRADGTPFPGYTPKAFSTLFPVFDVKVVAVDLDGDGVKEIVIAYENNTRTGYTIEAFQSDGLPYGGWSLLSFPDLMLQGLSAADLDNNGTIELVISEYNMTNNIGQIRVLDSTGMVRPGWPVVPDAAPNSGFLFATIGVLDRNNRKEILVTSNLTLTILRDDGTNWRQPLPVGDGSGYSANSAPLVADINGDGVPEILIGNRSVNWSAPAPYYYTSLECYRSDGSLLHHWPLFGLDNQQPFQCIPMVGDFSGTGRADIVANIGLIKGGTLNGWLLDSAVSVLSTGACFNVADGDWPTALHDPQNSRTIPQVPTAPTITSHPHSQAIPRGGNAALVVAASSYPRPTYQWRKGGAAINGATDSIYSIANFTDADVGSFTVTATNKFGSSTSNPAILTIATGYAAWADSFGLDSASGGDDPDGDGLVNLAEYALNRCPTAYDSKNATSLSTEAGQNRFRFTRPRGVTDVTYTVQVSTDLVTWIESPSTPTVESSTGSTETLVVVLDSSAPRRFARLQITKL